MKLSEKNLFSQFDPRSGKCNEKSENIMKYRKNLFLSSGRKVPTFWPLSESELALSGFVEHKNNILATATKKECLRLHVIVVRGEAETFFTFVAQDRNILLFFFWLITDIKFVLKIIKMKKYIFHVNFKYTKFLRFQPKFQRKFR